MPNPGDIPRPFSVEENRVDARLWAPPTLVVNKQPPHRPKQVALLPVVIFLTNTNDQDVTLTVPNSCAVSDWLVVGSGKTQYFCAEPPEEVCLQMLHVLHLPALGTIRHDAVLRLDALPMIDGGDYEVSYSFYGKVARTNFGCAVVS